MIIRSNQLRELDVDQESRVREGLHVVLDVVFSWEVSRQADSQADSQATNETLDHVHLVFAQS